MSLYLYLVKIYQNNYYLKPSYKMILFEDLLYTTSLKLCKVNYNYSFFNSLRYSSEQFGTFNFNFLLRKELRLYTERTDVSREFYSLSFENNYNIFDDSILKTSFSYKRANYLEKNVNFQSKKKNKSYNYSISVNYLFLKAYI